MEKLQIGEIIRALRKNKGVTQEQLAEVLDISTPAISKWESGLTNPDISMLPIIARYFQVTIDFLLGFSNELSPEDIKAICDDVIQKFDSLPFKEAQKEWSDYLRQYPTHSEFRYELATIGIFHLQKASSTEEMLCFANKLIGVFEQCTKGDELKVTQGSYFQMANLYIMLQDFDKAQAMLNQIPTQTVSPRILLSTIYLRKGDFEQANKNIQENVFRAALDIIRELGNKIFVFRMRDNDNINEILDLLYKQQQIISIFGLESLEGSGIGLQIAQMLAQNGEFDKSLNELEKTVNLLEKYPINTFEIKDVPFFKDVDLPTKQYNLSFPADAYKEHMKQGFASLEGDTRYQEIKRRLERALSIREEG